MFVNELYQGGIRALLDWDNTLFDNMSLPDDVALDDVVDHIIFKYGDAPLFSPDPAVMKYYITKWSARRLSQWVRFKNAIEEEYKQIAEANKVSLEKAKKAVSLEDVVGNNTKIGAVSGNTAESNIRRVTMDHDLVKTARNIGICLGD